MANIILSALVLILFFCLVWYISTRNKFIRLDEKTKESVAGIDVALEKRYDLLTKMVSAVEKYMTFEKETLEKVIELRQGNLNDKLKAESILSEVQDKISITVEAYPELKSSATMIEFQTAAQDAEDQLQASRRFYNANVRDYNNLVRMFPSSIVANNSGFTVKDFFETTEEKRSDVTFK